MPIHKDEMRGLLDEDGHDSVLSLDKEAVLGGRAIVTSSSALWRWLTIILSIFAVLDVAIYSYIAHILVSENTRDPMEIRNSYVGLDELYESGVVNSSYHKPIINKPRRFGHVSKAQPNQPSPVDEHRRLTSYGTVSPPDEHLRVSADIRTIVQFRIIDYGMESCQLALRIPSVDDPVPEPFLFRGSNGVATLDVCELDADDLIDVPKLTWARRPACKKNVGTFTITAGHEALLPQFPCKSRSLHSYEISCSERTPDCLVDVWATYDLPLGVYLYQHQTV